MKGPEPARCPKCSRPIPETDHVFGPRRTYCSRNCWPSRYKLKTPAWGSPETKATVISLRREGLLPKAIAPRVRLSPSRVRSICRSVGIYERRPHKPHKPHKPYRYADIEREIADAMVQKGPQ